MNMHPVSGWSVLEVRRDEEVRQSLGNYLAVKEAGFTWKVGEPLEGEKLRKGKSSVKDGQFLKVWKGKRHWT
jgi:hypothetical protein